AALAAGLPESVPGVTVDRQCGSSQQAVHFAVQGVMAGAYDVVIAAGVESMTRVPMGSSIHNGPGLPFGPSLSRRYAQAGGLVPQGVAAELVAQRWSIGRQELDAYSLESHRRAARATDQGRFGAEIVPLPYDLDKDHEGLITADEGIRRDTSAEALAALSPVFVPGGCITAGNSSQLSDGAAASLIMSETMADRLGMVPRARMVAMSLAGVDPITMLTGPIPATAKVLGRSGLTLDDIDVVELNEAFASVVVAWTREHHLDPERLNPNGGAIALGHPIGCSGTRLLATLVNELERIDGRYGLQVMCEGGGMANALIIERLR
ncbi:MAG: thiolase family protein, partial [Pseudonocardiaceae bacterium]